MFYGTCPSELPHKRTEGGWQFQRSKRPLPPPSQMKNLRDAFYFRRRSTPVSCFLPKNPLRDTGNSNVSLFLWHQKFTLKGEGHKAASLLLVPNFSPDFQGSLVSDKTLRALGQSWVTLWQTDLTKRWQKCLLDENKQKNTEKENIPGPSTLGEICQHRLFHILRQYLSCLLRIK